MSHQHAMYEIDAIYLVRGTLRRVGCMPDETLGW